MYLPRWFYINKTRKIFNLPSGFTALAYYFSRYDNDAMARARAQRGLVENGGHCYHWSSDFRRQISVGRGAGWREINATFRCARVLLRKIVWRVLLLLCLLFISVTLSSLYICRWLRSAHV